MENSMWKSKETVDNCFIKEKKTGKRCKIRKKNKKGYPIKCGKHQKNEKLFTFYRVDNIVYLQGESRIGIHHLFDFLDGMMNGTVVASVKFIADLR